MTIAIIKYATEDLNIIKASENNISVPKCFDFGIASLMSMKLSTLGFLCKLVEDGANVPSDQWMRYHAERPGFEFEAQSLDCIPSGFFNGFSIFLDEFVGNEVGVYIRNLARAAKLRCIVANTNTRIANLTMGLTSGGSGSVLWSLVINKLHLPQSYYDHYNLGVASSNLTALGQNDPRIEFFFNHFLNNQVSHLRPGVSGFLEIAFGRFLETIKGQRNPSQINIRQILDHVIENLSKSLCYRKPSLQDGLVSHWAKIALLFPNVYQSLQISDNMGEFDKAMHHPNFIEKHLYHLTNPWKSSDWIFMTFVGTQPDSELSYVPYSGRTWLIQSTQFNEKELFTILGCISIPFFRTVTSVLNFAVATSHNLPSSIGELENALAFKLPGDALEISAVVSIVDSSHHFHAIENEKILNTFAGQLGVDFIKNLIVNMIKDYTFMKTIWQVTFQFPSSEVFDLEHGFLAECHVPYIYGINRKIELLDSISDPQSSVYFGTIERTPNSSQIDCKFEMRYKKNKSLVTAECKNRQSTLHSGDLEKIISKSVNIHKAKLCLVFCNQFREKANENSKFIETCSRLKVNVYRVNCCSSALLLKIFAIEPFGSNFPIISDPESICIVLESKRINQDVCSN